MERRKALLQLRIVQSVLRREREGGGVSLALRQRAADVVQMATHQVHPAILEDEEWAAVLESIRSLMADDEV